MKAISYSFILPIIVLMFHVLHTEVQIEVQKESNDRLQQIYKNR